MNFKLRFHVLALREWKRLDGSVRDTFKKKLAERLTDPRVPQSALLGMKDCYKIKLVSLGYRLVYRVDDAEIFVTVIAAVHRRIKARKNKVYQTAEQRL